MRIVVCLFYVLSQTLFSQVIPTNAQSAFEIKPSIYTIIDSNEIARDYKLDRKYQHVAVYKAPHKLNLAYYLLDSNRWTAVFLNQNQFTVDYKLVDFDEDHSPELILYFQEYNYNEKGGPLN